MADELDEFLATVQVREESNGGTPPPTKQPEGEPPISGNPPPAAAPIPQNINLKETFGEGFEDLDKVKQTWQDLHKQNEELVGLRQTKTDLETQLANPQGLFADPEIMNFNNFFKATKLKDFGLYEKVKTHDPTADPLDTLVLNEILNNPELRGKEEIIKRRLMKTHGVDPSVNSAEEVEMGNIGVQQEAKKAIERINEIKQKLAEVPQLQQKTTPEDARKVWSPIINEELSTLNSIEIPIKRGDKVEKLMDYALTPELKSKFSNQLTEVFSNLGGEAKPEFRSKVKEAFTQRFLIDHLPDIIHAVETNQRSALEQEYDKKYNGVKFEKPPGGGGKPNVDDNDYSKLFGE